MYKKMGIFWKQNKRKSLLKPLVWFLLHSEGKGVARSHLLMVNKQVAGKAHVAHPFSPLGKEISVTH